MALGYQPGMQSLLVLLPESGQCIVVMTNSDDGLLFAKEVANGVLGLDGVWDIVREAPPGA